MDDNADEDDISMQYEQQANEGEETINETVEEELTHQDMTIYNILSSYLSKVTGTLQNFSSILVYKGNELQKIQEDGNKLTEELAVEKEQLEIQNNKALSFQRSFHDSFENVLKKQRC